MKTSNCQFEMLVTFMEQHGDLSKPSGCARGKIQTLQYWEELKNLLNSDASGEAKTVEKWKKVWSDFKNNTKRKAARIHRASTGTGGGPALLTKLSYLEQRVLNLVGVEAATGIANVEEAGFLQINLMEQSTATTSQDSAPPLSETENVIVLSTEESGQDRNIVEALKPDRLGQTTPRRRQMKEPGPSHRIITDVTETLPALTGHTTPHRIHSDPSLPSTLRSPATRQITPRTRRVDTLRAHRSPRRRARIQKTVADRASEEFLHSDSEWRKFLVQQHSDKNDSEKERLRLKAVELQLQERWQQIFDRMISVLDKFLDSKVEKK